MSRNYVCQQTGKIAFYWKDGLFFSIYCVCGIKITIDEEYILLNGVGKDNKYVPIPKHETRSLKKCR